MNSRSSHNSFARDCEDEWLSEIVIEVREALENETPLHPQISRLLQDYHLDHRNHQPSFDADIHHPFLHMAEPDSDVCPLDPIFHAPFGKNISVDSSATISEKCDDMMDIQNLCGEAPTKAPPQLYTIIEETERQVNREVSSCKSPRHDRRIQRYIDSYDLGQCPHTRKRVQGQSKAIRAKYDNDQRQLSHLSSSYPQIRSPSTAQNDPGANRSVTNDRSLLINFKWLDNTYDIGGIAADEVALQCTGFGYLPWVSDSGESLMVRCLYSPQSDGTIISPNDVCAQYRDRFKAYNFFAVVNDDGYGHVEFINHKHKPEMKFLMTMANNLWYHTLTTPRQPLASISSETRRNAKIKNFN